MVMDILVFNVSFCDDVGLFEFEDDFFIVDIIVSFENIFIIGMLDLFGDGIGLVDVSELVD